MAVNYTSASTVVTRGGKSVESSINEIQDISTPIAEGRNPTESDWDYPVGKQWFNTATKDYFKIINNTEDNAVWVDLNSINPEDLGTMAFQNSGSVEITGGSVVIDGKGLSEEDFTTGLLVKLTDLPENSTLQSSLATKLEANDIQAGDNITVDIVGNTVTINSEGGVAPHNLLSDDDITIQTTKTNGNIDIYAEGTGSINCNSLVSVADSRGVVSGNFSTPNYNNAAGYGVSLRTSAGGSWATCKIANKDVTRMGTGSTTTEQYGFEVFDSSVTARVSLEYNATLNEYGIYAKNGTSYMSISTSDTGENFRVVDEGAEVFKVEGNGIVTTVAGVFPNTYGTSGQVLSTNGAGQLQWVDNTESEVSHWSFVEENINLTAGNFNYIELTGDTTIDFESMAVGGQVIVYNVSPAEESVITVALDGTREFFNFNGNTQATVTISRAESLTLVKRPDGTIAYLA